MKKILSLFLLTIKTITFLALETMDSYLNTTSPSVLLKASDRRMDYWIGIVLDKTCLTFTMVLFLLLFTI